MNKKLINIHVRGGIGDFCLASIKFDGIIEEHKDNIIQMCLNTPDYVKEEVLDLARLRWFENLGLIKNQGLRYITQLNHYSRESSGAGQYIKDCDRLYDLNLWSEYTYYEKGESKVGGELWKIEDVCPEIESNYFHPFNDVLGKRFNKLQGTICIQPFGDTTKYLWLEHHWRELVQALTDKEYFIVCFGSNSQKDLLLYILGRNYAKGLAVLAVNVDMEYMVSVIKGCEMFIGCDSGFKNIALLLEKPVVMINNPDYPHSVHNGKAKDVWFPEFYRKNDKRHLIVEDFDVEKVVSHCLEILS